MRHKVAGFKLGRNTPHRKSMRRNMAIALFTHGQITTTIPKAKSVRPLVEKLITLAKKGDLASRRRVIKQIGNPILVDRDLKEQSRKELRADGYKVNKFHELQDGPRIVKKLFDDIAPRYTERPGGYTRIVRLSRHRIGDGSQLCVLQLVGQDEEGPQVSGQYSRRREKANKRMEFAAKLRKKKGKKDKSQKDEESDTSSDEEISEDAADEATEDQETQTPDEEASEDASTESEKGDASDNEKSD